LTNEWEGVKPELGLTALKMFAGTARLVEKMIAGEVQVGFNPQGAKHHAHYDYSSGFCVFNDFAWAAKKFAEAG
jgi:acetoin utilization deacetylase AcuC-like enzyme